MGTKKNVRVNIRWDVVNHSTHYVQLEVTLPTNTLIQLIVEEGARTFKVTSAMGSSDKNGYKEMSVVPFNTQRIEEMDVVFDRPGGIKTLYSAQTPTMPKKPKKGDLIPITEVGNLIVVYKVVDVKQASTLEIPVVQLKKIG